MICIFFFVLLVLFCLKKLDCLSVCFMCDQREFITLAAVCILPAAYLNLNLCWLLTFSFFFFFFIFIFHTLRRRNLCSHQYLVYIFCIQFYSCSFIFTVLFLCHIFSFLFLLSSPLCLSIQQDSVNGTPRCERVEREKNKRWRTKIIVGHKKKHHFNILFRKCCYEPFLFASSSSSSSLCPCFSHSLCRASTPNHHAHCSVQ